MSYSLFDLVQLCDNARINSPVSSTPFDSERLIPWRLSATGPAIGLLRPAIVDRLITENERSREQKLVEVWRLKLDLPSPFVSFQDWLDTSSKRTAVMKELCERWRDTGLFPDVCGPKKWRSEMYPVYRRPFSLHDHPNGGSAEADLNYAFEMERAACALFGVITYGVHMSIYDEEVAPDGTRSLRVWVPTRAKTKQTWPGYLDNTVAGGIPSGMSIFDSLVKEAMEEASIPEYIIRKHARASGVISYFFRTAAGWLQPEVEYIYDICIPPGADPGLFKPEPLDGEVESFDFMHQKRILQSMHAGLFKPNCAIVLIDLLIRLGYITPDEEPQFLDIVTRLHGRFDYDRW